MSDTPRQFFKQYAGFSHGPGETLAQGRDKCARRLAAAERIARERGYTFEWGRDPHIDSSDFCPEISESWPLWCCIMHDATGGIAGSLGGIDFGQDKQPWSDPYRRVVEAELALDIGGEPQS